MPNRDKSTEKEPKAEAVEAPARAFPTSQDVANARRAAGKIRPLHEGSIAEFLAVAADLKSRAKG